MTARMRPRSPRVAMMGTIPATGPEVLCLINVRIKSISTSALKRAPRTMARGSAIQKFPVFCTNSNPIYVERRAIPAWAKLITRVERQTKTMAIAISA